MSPVKLRLTFSYRCNGAGENPWPSPIDLLQQSSLIKSSFHVFFFRGRCSVVAIASSMRDLEWVLSLYVNDECEDYSGYLIVVLLQVDDWTEVTNFSWYRLSGRLKKAVKWRWRSRWWCEATELLLFAMQKWRFNEEFSIYSKDGSSFLDGGVKEVLKMVLRLMVEVSTEGWIVKSEGWWWWR